METLRRRLSIFIFCSTFLATCALAQSTLTQVQDTVYTPNGTLFNGTVVITWLGSSSPTGTSPAPYNTSVKIYNGALSVLLVPSTTATPPADYQAVYNSSDGLVTWTETWQVPPSSTPLTLSEVRVSGSGSTSGGGTGGGNTGGTVAIAQVTGLSSFLSALNSSVANLTAMVNALNTTITNMSSSITTLNTEVNGLSSGTTNAIFQDAETPGGTIDGNNTSFTLAYAPAGGLMIFLNGLLQANGVDYTASGANITFTPASTPQPGDVLLAYYRVPGTGPLSNFVDDDIPQGTIDGNNVTFTLSEVPNPPLSLKLFKNGALLQQNTDYTLSGSTITFASQSVPLPGDTLCAYYRTTTSVASPSISAGRDGVAPAHRDR